MNILIVGNGGREHALAWKASKSPLAEQVFVAPGNAGTALEPALKNIAIEATDIPKLVAFASKHQVGLTIIGPEAPLIMGVVDAFRTAGLQVFGPTRAAAQLEGSKTFAKDFLSRYQIPTGKYQSFTKIIPALLYVRQQCMPIVIKADGLAAGKGVIVAMTINEAETAIENMLMGNAFGDAGHRIVIEEFLEGEEVSFIVMVDGEHVLSMATSQDHKRLGNGDTGPNTGGMGAYSPALVITDILYQRIMDEIIWPTVRGMAKEGNVYTGILYAGLIISRDGQPKVIEFNCRFGDPETQPIMLRMHSDLVEHCIAAIQGKLDMEVSKWNACPAIGIVLAAKGYPEAYHSGDIISGLPITEIEGEKVFHAGTCLENGNVLTKGGRVLCVTALGNSITMAQNRAYHIAKSISWQDIFYRQDIGYRAITPKL